MQGNTISLPVTFSNTIPRNEKSRFRWMCALTLSNQFMYDLFIILASREANGSTADALADSIHAKSCALVMHLTPVDVCGRSRKSVINTFTYDLYINITSIWIVVLCTVVYSRGLLYTSTVCVVVHLDYDFITYFSSTSVAMFLRNHLNECRWCFLLNSSCTLRFPLG